jgi:hypothetical protein
MSPVVKVLLGISTLIQFPVLALILSMDDPSPWLAVPFGLVYWGLWFFYLWDIRQNERVPKEKERAWWWAIFLGGPFMEPVYFWRFIWGGGPGI